ncbi:glycosyltransferase family 10 domain-containing protein [Paenibacillus sp. 598K]|uniref:glycosyltransferase family 10 domain-containing protein n=1 Tax=Paenibacillus sp. 598K TaxID=1117987 RepID=UPI000FFF687B|nr:glycosyltransferase family 10 [Paenibacillus sp. 598K]
MKQIVTHNLYDVFNHSNVLFNPDSPYNHDNLLQPFHHLKKHLASQGYNLVPIAEGDPVFCDYLLFFDMPPFILTAENSYFTKYLASESFRRKMLLVLFEPPVVYEPNYIASNHRYFSKVLTWMDDLLVDEKYVKFHWPQSNTRYPRIPFEQKKNCVLINSDLFSSHNLELYSERRRAIRFFEQRCPDEFDLFGKNWSSAAYPSYRGTVASKGEILPHYKFSICYENARELNGYITEKIFDCFHASCVPIYYGAANIEKYIPADTFIDFRKFPDYDSLYAHISAMSAEEHEAYLDRVEQFLASPAYLSNFTQDAFSHKIIETILEMGQNR